VIRAAAKILFLMAWIAAAFWPAVRATPATNSPAYRLFACTVSNDPSPPDFSDPAGAVPLGLAMADFTGDSNPDMAILELNRLDSSEAYYVIKIQLTEGGRQSLKLTAPARSLVITPMDVTGDGTLDLVVRSVGSKVPVAVFVNDGCGHFYSDEADRFSTAVRELPTGPDVSSTESRFGSAAAARGPNAADSHTRLRRSRRESSSSHFFAHDGAPLQLFLPLQSDRAPPAAA